MRRARRHLEAFEDSNRYQRELKGTTLALIRYLEEHWRTPGWRADFDSWWPVIERYAAALNHDGFTGRGARDRLWRLLDRNQDRPMDL